MQKKSDSALSLVSGGLAAAVLLAGPSAALAGGNGILIYGALTVSVPTLGGWVLPVLAGLLAVIALRILRAKGAGGKTAAVAAIGAGAMMAAGGGFGFLQESHAIVPASTPLSNPDGGQVPVPPFYHVFENTSGVHLRILQLTPPACYEPNGMMPPGGGPTECATGLSLANGAQCFTSFDCNL